MIKTYLKDICIIVTDGTHDSPKLRDEGVPFIKGKHISSGEINFDDSDFISEEDHLECIKRVKPQRGDILLANIGSVGDTAKVKTDREFSIKNVALLRADEEKVDSNFLFYWLKSATVKKSLLNLRAGSAQQFISLKALRNWPVEIKFDQATQQNYASKLSKIDNLIENNRRRIALLEEAARLLYREWFVHFRFPSNATDFEKVTNLEGWEKTTLGKIAETNPQSYTASNLPNQINYIDISSVQTGRIVDKSSILSENAPGRARRICRHGDIIWSNVRPNLKSYSLVLDPQPFDVFSTGFTVLRAICVPWSFLYLLTTENNFVEFLINRATGTSYPAVRPKDFESAEILIPPKALLLEFNYLTEPLFNQINVLSKQNESLTKARDLLLPRLMDGRITV